MKANICGKRVKLARIDKEMKQIELSAALSVDCEVEISQTSISDIEKGIRSVSDFELIALGTVLEVSPCWLLLGDKVKK